MIDCPHHLQIELCCCNFSLQAVESEQCPSFSKAMEEGRPVYTDANPSLADGLAVPEVGANGLATAQHYGMSKDDVYVVEEKWITLAILRLGGEREVCGGGGRGYWTSRLSFRAAQRSTQGEKVRIVMQS